MSMFIIILITLIACYHSASKSVILTTSNPIQQGATVIETPSEVNTNGPQWHIHAVGTQTWHLVIELDNTWGFDPYDISSISIQIDSPTIVDTTFSDLLFAFSVENMANITQYIAVNLDMDDSNPNKIVPGTSDVYCPQTGSTNMEDGDLETKIYGGWSWTSREMNLGFYSWSSASTDDMYDIDIINETTQIFPITFTIQNDPYEDNSVLLYESTTGGLIQRCQYEAFDTDEGLEIYFAVSDDGDEIDIESITITYSTVAIMSPTVLTTPPSVAPSTEPSIYPTNIPSIQPSIYPTNIPSTQPSVSPTDDLCILELVGDASWSASYLSINIYMQNTNDMLTIQPFSMLMDCEDIFDHVTNTLIGTDHIQCTVQVNINQMNDIIFVIDLSSTSTLNINDRITIKKTAIQMICNDDVHDLENDFTISSIAQPLQHNVPDIIISKQAHSIGVCDDLILDARSTTNLGGRNNAVFEWRLSVNEDITDDYVGSYVVIDNDILLKDTTYNIVLTVINWYGAVSTTEFDVYVSNKAVPSVYLHGITEYSSTNLNLNGLVDILGEITFDDDCLNEEGIDLEFEISWTVQYNRILENDAITIDEDTIVELTEFVDMCDVEWLSVDAGSLLQSGLVYSFMMNVVCIREYECDVSAVHELQFPYSAIQCKISGNDILLQNMDPEHELDFVVVLDGETFSYDPDDDNNIVSRDVLEWSWDCVDNEEVSCDYVLNDVGSSSGVMDMDLAQMIFEYDTHYVFTVTMMVSDSRNIYRDGCMDTFILEIITRSADDHEHNDVQSLIVTITSISTEHSVSERLRLLGNIVNNQVDNDEGMTVYEWQELNGLLSAYDIENYKETSSDNSFNLILKENVLESGKMYSFQLMVTQYDDMDHVIAEGVSVAIDIYVLKEPKILSDSFAITPPCNDTFESIAHVLSTPFSISVSADGDYTPFLYIFGYEYGNDMYYFDSVSMSESLLSNIYVPIGDFSIFVHVIDSKSSQISDRISCSISLESYSVCLDLESDIIDPFLTQYSLMSASATVSYILQETMVYVHYLYQYDGGDESCIQTSLTSILYIIYDSVLQSSVDLCHSSSHVILLSETITLWMNLVASTDHNYLFDVLQDILIAILDPCSYISDNVSSVEVLYVSQHSIITQIPTIYSNQVDVTGYLSPIIMDLNYHDLLYSLTSCMIELFRTTPSSISSSVYNLLSDALYISELIRVSLSIPHESALTQFTDFSIYSVRVQNQDIHVSVTDIDVSIPKDITSNTGSGSVLFDSMDVLIIGMNSSSDNDVSTVSDSDSECAEFKGILSQNSVSISLLAMGNDTDLDTSHLPSNVSFTFSCNSFKDGHCDESMQCSWYDTSNDIWQNDGCITEMSSSSESVECFCSHLTTFATIHNIHAYKCGLDNDYVSEWLRSTAVNGVNISMVIIFLLLFLFTMREVYPFFQRGCTLKHKSVFAVMLIGITAFLYIFVYIQAYITRRSMRNGSNMDLCIKLYTLLLLLPQVTLFMLFTLIFYTWFGLAHSFIKNLEEVQKRMRYSLFGVNIFIWCFLCLYYGLILSENKDVFVIAAYMWSTMLSIAAIFITIYSILVGKVLYKAARISQYQSFAAKDWTVVRRLLIINSFLTLYFIFQAFSTIYLTLNPHYQTVIYSTLYSFMDALCLLFIFWMYRSSLHHLKTEELTRHKSNTLTIQRYKSNTLSHPDTARDKRRHTITNMSAVSPSVTATGVMAKSNNNLPSSIPMVHVLPSQSDINTDNGDCLTIDYAASPVITPAIITPAIKSDSDADHDDIETAYAKTVAGVIASTHHQTKEDDDVANDSLMSHNVSDLHGIGSNEKHLETIQ